jgi:hypothetical protein
MTEQTLLRPGDILPVEMRDGYEVHRAVLRRGLDVLLYPRQVLIATPPSGGPTLSFVHGIPETSALSAVTYAQDKKARREMIKRAGVPIPPGAVFAIGKESAEIRAFAKRVGYPVVVKAAGGENLREIFAGVRDERELTRVIDHFRVPEDQRLSYSKAAYGLTLLSEPVEEDGRIVSPASYQILIERHMTGSCLRFVVLGGSVLSVLRLPQGTADLSATPEPVSAAEVHESILELGVAAAHAIPGLTVAALDMVLDDHRLPAAQQQVSVVEFSERPSLAWQAMVEDALAHQIGDAIVEHLAEEVGVALADPRDDVSVDFEIEGSTAASDLSSTISALGGSGLDVEITSFDRIEGTVDGVLNGDAHQVALVFELLTSGRLEGQRAMLIRAHHRHN